MARAFLLRQWTYDLQTNLLARPGAFLLVLLGLGWFLPPLELALGARFGLVAGLTATLAPEPATAQLLMATVAGAGMTVVSVVYSILLVALSLASIQFSTRILSGFMRDQTSQNVLGLFVGSFAYCLAVIRAVQSDPPSVPGISVTLGLALSVGTLGALVLFIHHIVRSIQANVIADRIASETEGVLDAVFPPGREPTPAEAPLPLPQVVRADRSGYLQLVDETGLLAAAPGATLQLLRGNGTFVAAGVPLLAADRPVDAARLLTHVDLGPERTMQDDVEFGFRQLVDIALKALSPAVNDPSTAATCIDQLGRLLVRAAPRRTGPRVRLGEGGRLHVPEPTFVDLLDLSVEQIRQYGRADMATALRLMRVLGEVAPLLREPPDRDRVRFHAHRIRDNARQAFCAEDNEELERRHAAVVAALHGASAGEGA